MEPKEIIPNGILAIYEYDGKRYITLHDRYIFDSDGSWDYIFEEGSFSCDCNKSLFIQRQCNDKFPDLGCGDAIKLIILELVK